MNLVFVLGAGFSATQGYPLMGTLRAEFEKFVPNRGGPAVRGMYPQYKDEANRMDLSGSLGFEELFIKMRKVLDSDHAALKVIRWGVAGYFKHVQQEQPELKCCYANFIKWFQGGSLQRRAWGVVTLNWDLVVETAFRNAGMVSTYNIHDGGVPVIKPHGSINWSTHWRENFQSRYDRWRSINCKKNVKLCYDSQDPLAPLGDVNPDLRFAIFPGDDEMPKEDADLKILWDEARKLIMRGNTVVFIGYSLPFYDEAARRMLSDAVGNREVEVVDTSPDVLNNYKSLFGGNVKTSSTQSFEESPYSQPPPSGGGRPNPAP